MILILGGTHEGREIAEKLNQMNRDYILSVTTALGYDLYHETARQCVVQKFTEETLSSFIQSEHIELIIDATHPHAAEIKKTASRCAAKNHIAYWRYARRVQSVAHPAVTSNTHFKTFEDITAAITYLKETAAEDARILVTGTKHIPAFLEAFLPNQCVFRIMPGMESMAACIQNGVPTGNIIAVKAPCPAFLNRSFFKAYNIHYFVFKNSGAGSAFDANLESLSESNVTGIIIEPETIISAVVIENVSALEAAMLQNHF
ncbi:MAG: precorrin-6A/cobalt-precorrin-6A reductase [Clostridiales bacterium]|jgi:precorrin-6A/cobalt-precorrin-6A reductase|nr:precorrin-6A/cobalt-precorrin-6A reductase [Clostridiales bacterium]